MNLKKMMRQYDNVVITYVKAFEKRGIDPFKASVLMWGNGHHATEYGKTPEEALCGAMKRYEEEYGEKGT